MIACPKCGYRSRSDPDVADGQCPKCGVIYDLYTGPRIAAPADEGPRKSGSALKMFIALGVSAASFAYFGYELLRNRPPTRVADPTIRELTPDVAAALRRLSSSRVVMFASGAAACRECAEVRALFERKGVDFAELDPGQDAAARRFAREQLKRIDVPIVVIDNRMFPGYSEDDLAEALDAL